MRDRGLEEAIRAVGGVSELARQIGISQPSVSNWNRVPAERVLLVEAVTGVDRKVLRPDLYGPAKTTPEPDDDRAGARAGIRAARHAARARAGRQAAEQSCHPARRRDAARRRACRAGAGRQRNHGRARRARVLRSVHRPRPRRSCCPTARTISPASCTSARWRGCATISPARHRARRGQQRAGGSRRDPVRDHGRFGQRPSAGAAGHRSADLREASGALDRPVVRRPRARRCRQSLSPIGTLGRVFIEIETEAFALPS